MEAKNIWQRIQAVSNEIKNIEKGLTVGSGTYSYKAVGDLDVTLAVKAAETKHGLVSVPIKQELVNSEIIRTIKKNGDEGLTIVDTIKMTVRIVNLDNPSETVDIETFGKGIDSGDKGFGKASTYARKYALLNAYKIATGEDPDAEKSEETKTPKTVSEKRLAVENYLANDVKLANDMCKHFGVEKIGDLSDANIEQIFVTYKKKGLM